MKIRVHYENGKIMDFVVSKNILVVDFIFLCSNHGEVSKIEFL